MATGKPGLFVVVWEWENKQRRWRPYPPEVTQQLERAFQKNLRSVFLGDSDPFLKNYCIHLPQMEQECKVTREIVKVRRNFFPQSSPAGQGAVWQWSGDVPDDWHTYDMHVQCIIEESWAMGTQTLDMSIRFPACPYIINFCNLTQMNNKTGYIRGIRRIQQAAYPVGKPPQLPQYMPGSNSDFGFGFTNVGKPVAHGSSASASGERPRRRGSREEAEVSEGKHNRKLFDLVTGRGSSSSSSNSSSNSSRSTVVMGPPSAAEEHLGVGARRKERGGRASPPKPLPRSILPVPTPRTNLPGTSHLSYQQLPHTLPTRQDSSPGKFGSSHTLDSDCSSLISSRRPSVDTISTYLSQDSSGMEEDLSQVTHHSGQAEAGAVVDLINVHSDESMDDEVFGEDQEVCEVLGGAAGHSSPPRAPSPLPHSHHQTNSHSRNQDASHFMPINAPQSGSDLGLQVNGVKRKRTGERAQQKPPHYPERTTMQLDNQPSHYHTANNNHHHHSHHHACTHHHHHHHHTKPQHGSRAPIAPEDELLVQYTSVVSSPPDEMCSICMWKLTEPSGYAEEDQATSTTPHRHDPESDRVVSLKLCKHPFHLACIRQLAKSSPQFLECPNCKTLHGEKMGIQPAGRMDISYLKGSLPGYPNCNVIKITYSIQSGIQGPEHPNPGRPYRALGFPRTAYLPNNQKGKKVLKLLHEAWRRRLVFTIGTSVTTGMEDSVTWNEIHHKTEWTNYSGHGYPDPSYLDNTLKELALHGITESTLV